jgi:hypothetical protein
MSTALVAPRDKMGRRGLVKCGLGSGSGLARALHCWLGLYTAGSGFTLLAPALHCWLRLLRARAGSAFWVMW